MQISEITLSWSFNEVRDCLSNLDPSKPPAPMEFLRAFLNGAASKSRQVFVPYSIILYVLGAFLQIGSQLILRQFIRKIFRSQLKIIDQSHYSQSWVKLWNAASVTGFFPMTAYIFTTRIHAFSLVLFATFVRTSFNRGGTCQKQTDRCSVPWFCQDFRYSWPRHSYWKAEMIRCYGPTTWLVFWLSFGQIAESRDWWRNLRACTGHFWCTPG